MRRQADPTKSRQYRIDHGLCPLCGKEAAPYYLCHSCRQTAMIGRMCDLMAKRGVVKRLKDKGRVYYQIPPGWNGRSTKDFNWSPCGIDLKDTDKRLRPRIGRRPVDLDETLTEIFMEAGTPLTMEEIVAAWGRLRSKRKTSSLAGDMTAIIAAERRRNERNARRAAIAGGVNANQP